MEFLYPNFLYALAAIAIPIIVHLFNFRRFKKIPFTNVRFLREVKFQTQSQSRLKHLLVMLMRILAIVFLVLAFAQPYIPEKDAEVSKGPKSVSIFVDNSFSMDAENEGGVLLEQAKNRAIDIASVYEATDQYQLLTNDFEGRHQRFVNRDEFIQMVEEIQSSPASRKLDEIYSRQRDQLSDGNSNKIAFVLSDFQNSLSNINEVENDTTISLNLVPFDVGNTENLFVDSIWFETPTRQLGQSEELKVRIRNSGEQSVENVPLKLNINGSQQALASFSVEAGSFSDTTLFFTNDDPGAKHAVVSLQDSPVNFDDDFYFYFNVSEEINILSLQENLGEKDFFAAIFSEDPYFNYSSSSVKSVNYSELHSSDLIILNEINEVPSGLVGALNNFIDNGGSVFIIPGQNIVADSYGRLASQLQIPGYNKVVQGENSVSEIAREHPLFTGVFEQIPSNIDLPVTSSYYQIGSSVRSGGESLLSMRNGDSFLSLFNKNSGKIYLSAVPLSTDKNNFAQHAIFVTSTLRIAEMSRSSEPLFRTIGETASISLAGQTINSEDVFHLRSVNGDLDLIPEFRSLAGKTEIFASNSIQQAGNYAISLGEEVISGVGFNYSRKESDLSNMDRETLRNELDANGMTAVNIIDANTNTFKAGIEVLDQGTRYWKICLILALVFLGLETLLLRFWKN